ncbi:MAG: glycosyltransferase [Candidatus Kapabacteria bacterium]|nr:glycosyltransferase [Candidatus Kapabacteria bacterium]
MNILQLSPQCPYPKTDGGKIGIASILEHLSLYEDVKVTFAFFSEKTINEVQKSLLAQSSHRYIEIPHSTRNTFTRIVHSVITNKCLYLEKHQSDLAISILTDVMIEENIQIIHVDHSAMMPLALELQAKFPCKIGYRLHNIEWLLWHRYAESIPEREFKRRFLFNQAKLLKKAEKSFIEKADILFPISTVDLQHANELSHAKKAVVVSAGVMIDYWKTSKKIVKKPTIVLATTYDWIPNRDGLEWFLKEVFPLIVTKIPTIQFQLIGKNAEKHCTSTQNIEVIGYVDDVRSYIQSASVSICPLFVGSGIRIKILESLAAGTVVVSTSVGAEGIEATEQDGLFVTDEANQFARYCIELVSNTHKSQLLGQKAQNYTQEYWKWSTQIKKMYTEYTSLIHEE